jgi:hypothetical protein
MDKLILQNENKDLTDTELAQITNGKCEIISYHQLANYNNIDDVLGEYKAVIILYETTYNRGHFTALHINNNNQLEFFDPYGMYVDKELNWAKYNEAEGEPYLSELISKSNYDFIYNKIRLQVWNSHTNTCGRWCALRIIFRDYVLKDFQELFKNNRCYNGDFWTTALTLLYTINTNPN